MSRTKRACILVCGGAGYIGSQMCKVLASAGHLPVALDNLSTGHAWAVKWGPLVQADLLDPLALAHAFDEYRFEAVLHFAARSLVHESTQDPGLYFRNNVTGTLNLLDAMRQSGVRRMVFSSTAAVYGNPRYSPIDEEHPTQPINPYGWSKLMAERQIAEYCHAFGMSAVSLRYFNAAGADPDGEVGEAHNPETHLIPNVIMAATDPGCGPARIFGDDYPTKDGTCVRDYIHVQDLCEAHLAAMRFLGLQPGFHALNLGTGTGHSVAEVLETCRRLCGDRLEVEIHPRRDGDPATLVASSTKALQQLSWRPEKTLLDCIQDALQWHSAR